MHERPVGEHEAIEFGDLGFAMVVELLAHPLADLMRDLARVDRRADAAMERKQEIELREIGFDGRRHLGILQLAGERLAVEPSRFMHLAERGRGGGLQVELGKALAPAGAELGLHAAAHEARAHRRRLRLQTNELGRVVGRQRVGDRRQELGDFHHRALHRAQGRGQRLGVRLAPAAAQPVDADPRRKRPGADAEARIARGARAQAIGFVVSGQGQGPWVGRMLWPDPCNSSRVDAPQPVRPARRRWTQDCPSVERGDAFPGDARDQSTAPSSKPRCQTPTRSRAATASVRRS